MSNIDSKEIDVISQIAILRSNMEYYCNTCKQAITQAEYTYSTYHFRVPLCREHQEAARRNGKQPKVPSGTKSLDEVIFNSRVINNQNPSVTQDQMKIELVLKDERALRIVNNIPPINRDEILEKYIILGEMVTSHAAISTNKETIEEFFSPLRSDIDLITQQLKFIIPTVSAPPKKGKMTVETIFESLKEHFIDDSFEDVSTNAKFADISATTADSKTPILIELKDYNGTVPNAEVEKFWRDLERRSTKYGIFISMRSGIYKCSSCISVKTEMNKTAVFVNNSELNWSGHIFAYYVIKKIAEIESLKRRELKGDEISQTISRVNKHITDLQRTVESIDRIADIADGLRTTCNKKLDELISLSNVLKKNLNEGINEIITDLEKVEA
ncbi:MAG: hypothetical protein NWE93_13980 [Candidatus Bathyarchaeota archaeon]|nr:hypothetical protein [Candidatus Bathyarchaeota archaeon]